MKIEGQNTAQIQKADRNVKDFYKSASSNMMIKLDPNQAFEEH